MKSGCPSPRHGDNHKERINLPLHSYHGSLVIYHNDRHRGKAGEGIVLCSRHLGHVLEGLLSPPREALQLSAKRQLLLLANGCLGTSPCPGLLYNGIVSPSFCVFANSIKNCWLLLPLLLPAVTMNYLSSTGHLTRAGSQRQLSPGKMENPSPLKVCFHTWRGAGGWMSEARPRVPV